MVRELLKARRGRLGEAARLRVPPEVLLVEGRRRGQVAGDEVVVTVWESRRVRQPARRRPDLILQGGQASRVVDRLDEKAEVPEGRDGRPLDLAVDEMEAGVWEAPVPSPFLVPPVPRFHGPVDRWERGVLVPGALGEGVLPREPFANRRHRQYPR